jgi:hypothetical protein
MQNTALFPNMVNQMVAIGEESGALDSMLGKVADFFEAEVDDAVEALSSLMEPIIMVVLGVLIGGMVIAMYLPIFKLGANVKVVGATFSPGQGKTETVMTFIICDLRHDRARKTFEHSPPLGTPRAARQIVPAILADLPLAVRRDLRQCSGCWLAAFSTSSFTACR